VAAAEFLTSLQAAVAVLGGAGEAVVVTGAEDLTVLALNAAAAELLGDTKAEGRTLDWLFPEMAAGELRASVDALLRHGGRSMGLTTRPRWEPAGGMSVQVRLDLVVRDGVPLAVAFIRDSPEERALRPSLAAPSPLDDLPDRTALVAELDAEVRRAFRHGRSLAIVNVRLRASTRPQRDQQSVVHDAARRLRESVRAEETLGRSGPDSFVWILHEADARGARAAAERARRAALGDRSTPVAVAVGVAALTRGDSAADLLRRAELDTIIDPGPGRRGTRGSSGLAAEGERLLRAALDGDARAVADTLRACFEERGHAAAYDEVIQPALRRLSRTSGPEPARPAEEHRALALLEWGLARRPRIYAPPDSPVIAVLPMGVDARRVTTQAAADAAAMAGWTPVIVEVPPASDVTRPVANLGAQAVALVLGDDADLLETAHVVEDLAETIPGLMIVAMGPPGGILRRWTPPPPARALSTAGALVQALGGPSRRGAPAARA